MCSPVLQSQGEKPLSLPSPLPPTLPPTPFCCFQFWTLSIWYCWGRRPPKNKKERVKKDTDWRLLERSHIFITWLLLLNNHKVKPDAAFSCSLKMIKALFSTEKFIEGEKVLFHTMLKIFKIHVCHVKPPETIVNYTNRGKIALNVFQAQLYPLC